MGFSVSGATVILFLGIFACFGIAYTAANNGAEMVGAAYEDTTDKALTTQNTAISIASANTGSDSKTLSVKVNNTGSTTLSVDDTDILIDGNYTGHDKMDPLTVGGNAETNLWLPGETLRFTITLDWEPSRVKVVTENGVAASAEVQ
ncbi:MULTISPECIES: flagellin [Halorussus]|uniref:flagellin n=1 Tax=Halorussus TaxID=1070314 RepID=UPI0020A17EE6|nr:flagellin [Halorussus vallis]USZ76579.1 flagellin [Halorussus vallis]